MNKMHHNHTSQFHRRGSTLIIVIALLGLLSFTGMIFFSFSSQERAAAEYFSEAAKGEVDAPINIWDHPLQQIISGPGNRPHHVRSALWSPSRRHSMVSGMYGTDLAPYSGEGVNVIYEDDPTTADTTPVPRVDMDWDGTANDEDGTGAEPNTQTLLDYVDSPAARNGIQIRADVPPAPDVDYTYPDINNLFLAYKGWAIRDNDPTNTGTVTPRFERVPVIIPSFFRPQYLKTGGGNGFSGNSTPTDINWASAFDGVTRSSMPFQARSFRPHPMHIAGFQADGTTPVFRYLTDIEAASLGISSGGFPFIPEDNQAGQPGGVNGIRGELGIWTGSDPRAYELDADPDGDGIREGIWIDTHFPVQEYVDSGGTTRMYVVMHSFSIYDLDGLINLNVHGNLAGIDRTANLQSLAGGLLAQQFMSKSNLGLGPNEINPLWALRRDLSAPTTPEMARQFMHHFGALPTNPVELANMEYIWLLAGRADINGSNQLDDLFPGRWGDGDRLYNSFRPGGSFNMADLPRPGRAGNGQQTLFSGSRFGGAFAGAGRDGFDDNADALEGQSSVRTGRNLPFGTPIDYAGTGRRHAGVIGTYDTPTGTFPLSGDIRLPLQHHDTASTGPERFHLFEGYSLGRDSNVNTNTYLLGQNGVFDNGGAATDDLIRNPFYDPLFEDSLESIFDPELSQDQFDSVFGPQDVFGMHLTAGDIGSSSDKISDRVSKTSVYSMQTGIAPFSFNEQVTPGVRGRFTTISNSLRRFLMRSPLGLDGKPGIAGLDDDGDGRIDNLADLMDPSTAFEPNEKNGNGQGDSDNVGRAWEFSADTDGNGTDANGFPSGDGFFEFPPGFDSSIPIPIPNPGVPTPHPGGGPNTNNRALLGRPYSSTDPFRPQARRMLTIESGDSRSLVGQLPLSINHILDVERNAQTPEEGTPQFLRYMLKAGMRFRSLTDHPQVGDDPSVSTTSAIPVWTSASPVQFPPVTQAEREFWARRDRQKLARDIYVLLYATGGAGIDPATGFVRNFTEPNDASAPIGSSLYTHEQLRRMAQFAVNLVDAMDSDNIPTKFEYDKNLGPSGPPATATIGGWNMDDDPFATNATDTSRGWNEDVPSTDPLVTGNGLYPEDGIERGVVYGVEAQELTFSEVLAARSPQFTGSDPDSALTRHDDTIEDVNFLHIELQNMRPTAVPLASTVTGTSNEERAIWQLARIDRPVENDPDPTTPTQTLTLMEGNTSVTAGGRFTIAMAGVPSDPAAANPTLWETSDLYVDHDNTGDFELVSPDIGTASVMSSTPVTAQCDLDLLYATHDSRWLLTGNSTQRGQFLTAMGSYDGNINYNQTGGTLDGFDLVLRRRLNPNMPQLPLAENPWIEVDRVKVEFRDIFELEEVPPMSGMMQMVLNLDNAPSRERGEPLDATSLFDYTAGSDTAPNAWRYNTIGSAINSQTTGSFDLLQNHFDREYASTAELLTLPVVGPQLLTHRINRMRYAPLQQVYDDPTTVDTTSQEPKSSWISSGEAMLLQPDFPDLTAAQATALNGSATTVSVNSSLDNRWYRLLQFVEVPSRVHRMLGNYIALQKLPGKLNINMIRHREVLAGLIDNPYLADVPNLSDLTSPGGSFPGNEYEDAPFMTSAPGLGSRDLWMDMSRDRDGALVTGFNPITSTTAAFCLPGTPNARPFRSLGFRTSNSLDENGFDETLMRRMAADRTDTGAGTELTNRHWLELTTTTLHADPDSMMGVVGQTPSAETRHRILSKILNNTTTVSNTFLVYGYAAYFEAHEDPVTGLIRVGGRFDLDGDSDPTNDFQRAVFVIDRTEALEAYDPGSGDFNWNNLVKARATIK
jgi:hypothetical protein